MAFLNRRTVGVGPLPFLSFFDGFLPRRINDRGSGPTPRDGFTPRRIFDRLSAAGMTDGGGGLRREREWASPRSLAGPRDDRVEGVGWERADVTDWQCWASPRSYFESLPPQADLRQHERPHTGDGLTPRRTFSLPPQE